MSKNSEKNDIKVVQVNPKIRLFLLIFWSWTWILLLLLFSRIWRKHIFNIPFFIEHEYLAWILIVCLYALILFYAFSILKIGIKYLPKDLYESYIKKNKDQLKELENVEIINVTQLFTVPPVETEINLKNPSLYEEKFVGLSSIEESKNRLVVNGKINKLDFSWGIATRFKKNNFKVFFLSILYFGPIVGIIIGIMPSLLFNSMDYSEWSQRDYTIKNRKLGCMDLYAKKVEKLNSESYLIFAAKLQKQVDSLVLIPKSNTEQYEWPTNISDEQKNELQTLTQNISFLPNIYIYQDNISIIMKKYDYNEKDNSELQTWELLKNEDSNTDIQFDYLKNAIKIYNIFNKPNFN